MVISTEKYIKSKLSEIFNDISSIKNYDIGYYEFNSSYSFKRENWVEIKLQISNDDLISYNVMCKLMNEDSLREKIKKVVKTAVGENFRVNLTTYI